MSLHYDGDNIYSLGENKSLFLKPIINVPTTFCLGGISDGFDTPESRKKSLKGTIYNFLSIIMLLITLIKWICLQNKT